MPESEREKIIGSLVIALKELKKIDHFSEFMPEVRINFAYSMENPKSSGDVAAIPGRISIIDDSIYVPSSPEFGASDHMARNLIEFAKYNNKIRAAINIKYTEDLVEWLSQYCLDNNLTLSFVDRSKEPDDIKNIDGASIPWKIEEAVRLSSNRVPDVIIEGPAMGKEPLIILTGEDPMKVVDLFKKIHSHWIEHKKLQKEM